MVARWVIARRAVQGVEFDAELGFLDARRSAGRRAGIAQAGAVCGAAHDLGPRPVIGCQVGGAIGQGQGEAVALGGELEPEIQAHAGAQGERRGMPDTTRTRAAARGVAEGDGLGAAVDRRALGAGVGDAGGEGGDVLGEGLELAREQAGTDVERTARCFFGLGTGCGLGAGRTGFGVGRISGECRGETVEDFPAAGGFEIGIQIRGREHVFGTGAWPPAISPPAEHEGAAAGRSGHGQAGTGKGSADGLAVAGRPVVVVVRVVAVVQRQGGRQGADLLAQLREAARIQRLAVGGGVGDQVVLYLFLEHRLDLVC